MSSMQSVVQTSSYGGNIDPNARQMGNSMSWANFGVGNINNYNGLFVLLLILRFFSPHAGRRLLAGTNTAAQNNAGGTSRSTALVLIPASGQTRSASSLINTAGNVSSSAGPFGQMTKNLMYVPFDSVSYSLFLIRTFLCS